MRCIKMNDENPGVLLTDYYEQLIYLEEREMVLSSEIRHLEKRLLNVQGSIKFLKENKKD